MNIHWKDWCWSWNSNTLATWFGELTHWKRPWSWERLKARGEGDDRGWEGWMASLTRHEFEQASVVAACSLWDRRVGHYWATELTELICIYESESISLSVVSSSLWPHTVHGIPGQNTGVGNHSLLQGIFPTQSLNPGLPHCGQIFYHLKHQGSLYILRIF